MSAAIVVLIATTGAASANCVSVPDDQSSAYVRNGLNKTICLNDQIAFDTVQQNWKVEVNTALGNLDRRFVSNKLNAIRPVTIPQPMKPSWP